MSEKCLHLGFGMALSITKIEETGRFMAEVKICCRFCNEPFKFLGLPAGLNLMGAAVSPDGLEARLGICPASEEPPPYHPDRVIGFGIRETIAPGVRDALEPGVHRPIFAGRVTREPQSIEQEFANVRKAIAEIAACESLTARARRIYALREALRRKWPDE